MHLPTSRPEAAFDVKTMSDNYMSQESLERIKADLEELKNVKRKEITERISVAKEQGDLSENFEYQEAKEEQGIIERRIADLQTIINNAVVIEQKSGVNKITVGVSFTAELSDGSVKDFEIVGPTETDPMAGKISNESPLGNAFLGKKVGEEVKIETPSGVSIYKIVTIK